MPARRSAVLGEPALVVSSSVAGKQYLLAPQALNAKRPVYSVTPHPVGESGNPANSCITRCAEA